MPVFSCLSALTRPWPSIMTSGDVWSTQAAHRVVFVALLNMYEYFESEFLFCFVLVFDDAVAAVNVVLVIGVFVYFVCFFVFLTEHLVPTGFR